MSMRYPDDALITTEQLPAIAAAIAAQAAAQATAVSEPVGLSAATKATLDTTTKSDISVLLAVGDSTTAGSQDYTGISYPSILQTILNASCTVTNVGVSGYTSTEIGIGQGGINVVLPAFTLANTAGTQVTVVPISPTADFRAAGTPLYYAWTGTINGITVILRHHIATGDTPANAWTVEPVASGVGQAVTAGSFHCTTNDGSVGGVQIIMAGRNNDITTTTAAVSDVASMVANLSPSLKRYLILGVILKVTETSGSAGNTQILAINSALAAVYGAKFLDPNTVLRTSGLVFNGLTATAADTAAIAAGAVAPSLKVNDGLHPNQYGYRAIANLVINTLVGFGWTAGKRAAFPAITPMPPTDWEYRWLITGLASLANNALVASWATDYLSQSATLAQGTVASQPTIYTAADGKRYVKFDGISSVLVFYQAGNVTQPATILVRGKLRSIPANNSGLVWTNGSGAAFVVTPTGALQLNAGTGINTPAGQIVAGTNFTAAAVLNGTTSSVGVGANTKVAGDIGTGIFQNGFQIGYCYDGANRYAALDVEEVVVYSRALSDAEIAASNAWYVTNL